jgi:hypothetical protein
MVMLPPNPAISPLCSNDGCPRRDRCARFMTHWEAGASIARIKHGDECAYFIPIPDRPRARDAQEDNVLHFYTRSGRLLDRSGE